MTMVGLCLAVAAESYLLGSIDAGILVSRLLYHDDIRAHGSGNAGMTNILRTYGKGAAALTALGDGLKGVAAVFIARALFGSFGTADQLCGMYLAALFAVIGHMKPIFFGFKGGKGVMVGAGCALAINPAATLVLLAVFLAVFLPTRMVSLCSIIVAVGFTVEALVCGVWVYQLPPAALAAVTVCAALTSFLVVFGHRSNIQRIKNGTEYRFDGSHRKS